MAHESNQENIKNIGAYNPRQEILILNGNGPRFFVKATHMPICGCVESWALAGSCSSQVLLWTSHSSNTLHVAVDFILTWVRKG